ncbi:hypothetical protein D3C72_2432040 [compost metagenome]
MGEQIGARGIGDEARMTVERLGDHAWRLGPGMARGNHDEVGDDLASAIAGHAP